MKLFEEEKRLLNHDEIDELHKEFLDIYNSVDNSSIPDWFDLHLISMDSDLTSYLKKAS